MRASARLLSFSLSKRRAISPFSQKRAPTTPKPSHYLRSSASEKEIFLVGTSHVSKRSAQETEDTIRLIKPDVIAVELCEERLDQLKEQMKEEGDGKKERENKSFLRDFLWQS